MGDKDWLRGPHIIATAKHFLGDGGTYGGKDQGDTRISEAGLINTFSAPYIPALDAGVQSVMVSFSSWNGTKMHGNQSLLTGVMKQRWGFDGFLVGDWNGHAQVMAAPPPIAFRRPRPALTCIWRQTVGRRFGKAHWPMRAMGRCPWRGSMMRYGAFCA
jgi:hypothetical protein